MKQKITLLGILLIGFSMLAQETNPVITKWLQNTTAFGSYYSSGNSTPIAMSVLSNCQQVRYNTSDVYIDATGIPSYPTGIFSGDGNQSLAGNQNAIYKLPLYPTQNTGTLTATSGGNNGIFINGVSLFDYRDGVAYSASATNGVCGGPPGNPACTGGTQAWNRDAIPAEKLGFDCAKGHPAGTNYHHHQNPSAFKYDSTTSNSYSPICTLYDSEGLYVINTAAHSPLIGFAYDGFPIYGAYAYTNVNGTGAITRMKSSYQLKAYATGLRTNGPAINEVKGTQTFFKGYFKEDYEYVANPTDPTYLDEHNGRICVTPEYPAGIYCYFTTVNADHSSAYPYVIGPTFYGNKTGAKVTAAPTSGLTTFLTNEKFILDKATISIFPNPTNDYFTVQTDFVEKDLDVFLINELGQIVKTSKILQGSTLSIIEIDTIYNGIYFLKISDGKESKSFKVIIDK